jgi:hypothetical protein
MKIRSITYFFDPGCPIDATRLAAAAQFLSSARQQFTALGYEVQTVRLATPSFASLVQPLSEQALLSWACELGQAAQTFGIDYLALGPALVQQPSSYALIPPILAQTENLFFSAHMTAAGQIFPAAVRACAQVIHDLAPLEPNGFANLRFAALANVRPGAPFFPAAYHAGGEPLFAIATQSADLAVEAFGAAHTLDEARYLLHIAIEQHASRLETLATKLAETHALQFGGIDFSLAPFPERDQSLGEAMERFGLAALGLHGSLASAAILTETLDRARFKHTGFSGLMLPVLEDAVLAERAAEAHLSMKDLLLYSAVCGTGLDTVPLPGDASTGQIEAVLLDLAILAIRLDKPLTARLMPIPGRQAGAPTNFNFAFFANSRVMALPAASLSGLLQGDAPIPLKSRL